MRAERPRGQPDSQRHDRAAQARRRGRPLGTSGFRDEPRTETQEARCSGQRVTTPKLPVTAATTGRHSLRRPGGPAGAAIKAGPQADRCLIAGTSTFAHRKSLMFSSSNSTRKHTIIGFALNGPLSCILNNKSPEHAKGFLSGEAETVPRAEKSPQAPPAWGAPRPQTQPARGGVGLHPTARGQTVHSPGVGRVVHLPGRWPADGWLAKEHIPVKAPQGPPAVGAGGGCQQWLLLQPQGRWTARPQRAAARTRHLWEGLAG